MLPVAKEVPVSAAQNEVVLDRNVEDFSLNSQLWRQCRLPCICDVYTRQTSRRSFRRKFLSREMVRLRMEPLVAVMWCLTPWEIQPCSCIYEIQFFFEAYYLPPWWKHFPLKQRCKLKQLARMAFLDFHYCEAFFMGGEWYASNKEKILVKVSVRILLR